MGFVGKAKAGPLDMRQNRRGHTGEVADKCHLPALSVPAAPQCGFSATVVQILSHLSVPFQSVDVLADMEIREGIKAYSNWPTIPQLYVKGEFVGGCDIIREMFQTGELAALLSSTGVGVAAQ